LITGNDQALPEPLQRRWLITVGNHARQRRWLITASNHATPATALMSFHASEPEATAAE
jgi:hypothetical protein